MDWLPDHEAAFYLQHNEHKSYYETAEQWITEQESFGEGPHFDWVSDDERQKAIDEDSVWIMQWYPDTPIGFCCLAASSLDALKNAVLQGQNQ
jgi:hypothetical protein